MINGKTQNQVVLLDLFTSPKTMLQVSKETGIERANICRRIAKLREEKKVYRIGSGLCPVSKHKAGLYTTNPEHWKLLAARVVNLWEHLPPEPLSQIGTLIRQYYLNLYDDNLLQVPDNVADTWKMIKDRIDKEVTR